MSGMTFDRLLLVVLDQLTSRCGLALDWTRIGVFRRNGIHELANSDGQKLVLTRHTHCVIADGTNEDVNIDYI